MWVKMFARSTHEEFIASETFLHNQKIFNLFLFPDLIQFLIIWETFLRHYKYILFLAPSKNFHRGTKPPPPPLPLPLRACHCSSEGLHPKRKTLLSVHYIGQPFYISICILLTLPAQDTMFTHGLLNCRITDISNLGPSSEWNVNWITEVL